jgi:hypothetical protein
MGGQLLQLLGMRRDFQEAVAGSQSVACLNGEAIVVLGDHCGHGRLASGNSKAVLQHYTMLFSH